MSIENIRAVAAENSKAKPASIAAAVDKQLWGLSRVMAQAGVELNSVNKISASALSKKLKAAGIESQRRLEVKIALERAGLLAD
jgi:orotate phosphoribosyltransferase